MALTERLSVTRRSSRRSSSQSSIETEPSSCDRFGAKPVPCQSPMSLAQIISSTYKHSSNLLIPDPAFLKLLKTVGAKGERFVRDTEIYTVQQLCFYLKEYIKQKQLYDVNDVQVVYCRGDPLGDVLHVERFTVYDVLDLISKKSTPLLLSPSKNKMSISSESKCSDHLKVKQGGAWKISDDGGVTASYVEKHGNESSPKRSASSVNLSRIFCRYGGRGNELPCNVVTSTTDAVRNTGLKRSLEEEQDKECLPEKKICLDKSSAGAEKASFDSETQSIEKEALEQRFLLRVKDDAVILDEFSDVESTYSIQSKETAVVKDSSDDLWFLKEDDDVEFDTDDYSEIYADEYDVVSDISHTSSSEIEDDNDVFAEREDVIVIRDGSETEFADGELSDVDEDDEALRVSGESDRTSWQCIKCCHKNRAPDRLCDKCLNLRTEELHQGETSSASGSCKPKTSLLTLPVTEDCVSRPLSAECHSSDRQLLPGCCRSETDICQRESAGESLGLDSSLLQLTSSQESGFFSVDSEDVATPLMTSHDSYTDEKTEVKDTVTELNESKPQEGRAGQASASSNMCIICLSGPKVASLIHGATGHQTCCYQCACQLKRMRKPCPVCRRPIQKVIRNYVV